MLPWYVELILVLAAYIGGALTYRNNAKKAEAELARLKDEIRKAKEKVGL